MRSTERIFYVNVFVHLNEAIVPTKLIEGGILWSQGKPSVLALDKYEEVEGNG